MSVLFMRLGKGFHLSFPGEYIRPGPLPGPVTVWGKEGKAGKASGNTAAGALFPADTPCTVINYAIIVRKQPGFAYHMLSAAF